MFPGYNKPTDLMIDAGVLYRRDPDGANLIGVGASRGGLNFNPNRTMRVPEFDGRTTMHIQGLHRVTEYGPQITGTLIELSAANFGMYEPGSVRTVSGSSARITPIQATEFLSLNAYIYDLLWIGRRQNNLIRAIGFPVAICSQYDIAGEDKNEFGVNVTLDACIPEGATNINVAPHRIFDANNIDDLDALFPAFWDIDGYVGVPA